MSLYVNSEFIEILSGFLQLTNALTSVGTIAKSSSSGRSNTLLPFLQFAVSSRQVIFGDWI